MSIIANVWGLFALLFAFVAFLPLLGSLNWLGIPFAALGVVLGFIAKRPDGAGKFGCIASIIALIVGMFRLTIGGGIF